MLSLKYAHYKNLKYLRREFNHEHCVSHIFSWLRPRHALGILILLDENPIKNLAKVARGNKEK